MIKRFTLFLFSLVTVCFASVAQTLPCSELFFSQYVEGSGNNKAVEIYNPTPGSVDMSNYKVWVSYNGGTSMQSIVLNGTLAPGAAYVLAHTNAVAAIANIANQLSSALDFNGNDAVALINIVTSDTIDVIGVIGENPGLSWTTASGDETLDETLIRESNVLNGTTDWNTAQFQWFGIGLNSILGLGDHTTQPCGILSDPIVSFVHTSQTVGEAWFDVTVPVSITFPNNNPTSFTIGLAPGGTATPGVDFIMPAQTTYTFPANSSTPITFVVEIVEDMLLEPTEFFILQIQSVTNNGSIYNAVDTIFILDNDDQMIPPNVYLNPAAVTVPENGGVALLNVEIGSPNANPTTVEVTVSSSGTTATFGDDFTIQQPLVATFAPNSSASVPFAVTIIDDAIAEGNETITLMLVNPTNNATIGPNATAVITIIDNDPIGIAQFEQHGIRAWPNPAQLRTNVTANAVVERCDVYDTAGRLMQRTEPLADHFKLETADLPAGMYIVEAVTADRTLHFRLVKK